MVDSDKSTVSINITSVNDSPTATAQTVEVTENVVKTITLAGTDPDGDDLTFIINQLPNNGTLKDGDTNIESGDLPKTLSSTDVSYVSTSDVATSDVFEFRVKDPDGLLSPIVDVTINITAVNDAPTATAQTVQVTEQVSKQFDLSGTDPESDNLTFEIVDQPTNGTVSLNGATVSYMSSSNTATSDSFTFKVNDGSLDSDPATVTINITPVNDKPAASEKKGNNAISATENVAKTITLTGDDPDGDDLAFVIMDLPSNGTLTDGDTQIESDDLPKTLSSANVIYTSTSHTATTDNFKFRVKDPDGLVSERVDVDINITQVNDVPTVSDQTVQATEQVAKTITLSANDLDGDQLFYNIVSNDSFLKC